MALPTLYGIGVGRVPGAVLASLWFVVQNLPREPWLTHAQPGFCVTGVESVGSRVAGWLWAGQQFLNALLPVVQSMLLKVLVPSNILCREGEKIYSGNYSLTVW